jgi:hypothetical protein
MTMPTAEEVVCLYLYGQMTPPADLKTEALIRPAGVGAPVDVDMNEFMTTGSSHSSSRAAKKPRRVLPCYLLIE